MKRSQNYLPSRWLLKLALSIDLGKAPCAGNSGSISKRGNAASADFWAQPVGPETSLAMENRAAARCVPRYAVREPYREHVEA